MLSVINVRNSLQLLVCRSRKVLVTAVNHYDNQQMWAAYDPAAPTSCYSKIFLAVIHRIQTKLIILLLL